MNCSPKGVKNKKHKKKQHKKHSTVSFLLLNFPKRAKKDKKYNPRGRVRGRGVTSSLPKIETSLEFGFASLLTSLPNVCRVSALCPSARLLTLEPDNGLCAHMDVTSCDVTSATTHSSSVRVCTSAVQRGWSGTNTPPDEGGQSTSTCQHEALKQI